VGTGEDRRENALQKEARADADKTRKAVKNIQSKVEKLRWVIWEL